MTEEQSRNYLTISRDGRSMSVLYLEKSKTLPFRADDYYVSIKSTYKVKTEHLSRLLRAPTYNERRLSPSSRILLAEKIKQRQASQTSDVAPSEDSVSNRTSTSSGKTPKILTPQSSSAATTSSRDTIVMLTPPSTSINNTSSSGSAVIVTPPSTEQAGSTSSSSAVFVTPPESLRSEQSSNNGVIVETPSQSSGSIVVTGGSASAPNVRDWLEQQQGNASTQENGPSSSVKSVESEAEDGEATEKVRGGMEELNSLRKAVGGKFGNEGKGKEIQERLDAIQAELEAIRKTVAGNGEISDV